MKKLLLLLLCTKLSVLAMELPPAATGKKRPAAAADIDEIKEVKENAPPAKQSRQGKKIYTLKVPVSGSALTIDEPIDINESQDIIAAESIAELIQHAKETSADFILARVSTSDKGKKHAEYYDAINLHKSLFGLSGKPQNQNDVRRYTLKTPTRAPIVGEIYYYLYFPPTDSFDYLGTDQELFAEQNRLLTLTMIALSSPGNINVFWYELSTEYDKINLKEKANYYLEKTGHLKWIKSLYNRGIELSNNEELLRAASQFKSAYIAGYDLGAIANAVLLIDIKKKKPQDYEAFLLKNQIETIKDLVSVLQKNPVSLLLEYYTNAAFSRATKIELTTQWLEELLDYSLLPEQKVIIQKKLDELKKLA